MNDSIEHAPSLGDVPPDHAPDALSLRGTERFTMAEAATLKGVSYHTVSRAVRQGRLPVLRLGRMALISGEDLDNWQPMRERAPKRYRQQPASIDSSAHIVFEGALGERLELARQLATLFEIIHAASAELTLPEFGEVVATKFCSVFGLQRVSLWTFSDDGHHAERVATVGSRLSLVPDAVDAATKFAKIFTTVTHGHARVSNDPQTEFGSDGDLSERMLPSSPLLLVPLRVRDRTVGCIVGDRNGGPLALDDEQLSLARVLGNQVALAVDNVLLRKQEQFRISQLSAILDQLAEQVRACDVDGRLNLFNRSDKAFQQTEAFAEPILGSDALENPGISGRFELDGTPITRDRHPLARALRGESVLNWEYEVARSDGRKVRALVNATPIVIDGEITGAVYIGRNVTSEREAEQRDHERVARIETAAVRAQAIADSALEINSTDDRYRVVQILLDVLTDSVVADTGLAFLVQPDGSMEAAGSSRIPGAMQLPFDSDPISNSTTILALSRKAPVSVSFEDAGRAEQYRMTMLGASSLTVVPLQINSAHVGAFHLFRESERELNDDDVTFVETVARLCAQALERIGLNQDLEAARVRLVDVMNHVPQAVLVVEGADGVITTANAAVTDLLGEAIIPGPVRADSLAFLDSSGQLISRGEHPLVRALVSGERSFDEAITVVRPDGRHVDVMASHAPILGPEGEVIASVSVLQDRAQFSLVDRSKEQFLLQVIDELVQPIKLARAAAFGLLRDLPAKAPDARAELEAMSRVTRVLDRSSVMLDKLIEVSQADIGALPIHVAATDASTIIQDVVARISQDAPTRTIRITAPASLPVVWDQRRIEQSLQAVLENAVRYAPVGPIDVDGRLLDSGDVRITVQDTGPGIEPRLRDRLFGHFYPFEDQRRSEDGTQSGEHGLGLDLYLAGIFAVAHNGTLTVGEAEGGGARLVFTLPAVVAPDPS